MLYSLPDLIAYLPLISSASRGLPILSKLPNGCLTCLSSNWDDTVIEKNAFFSSNASHIPVTIPAVGLAWWAMSVTGWRKEMWRSTHHSLTHLLYNAVSILSVRCSREVSQACNNSNTISHKWATWSPNLLVIANMYSWLCAKVSWTLASGSWEKKTNQNFLCLSSSSVVPD